MNRWKNFIKRVLNPQTWIVLLLIPISIVLLVLGLSDRFHGTALAYISYLISSYTLTVSVWGFPKLIRFVTNEFWDIPLIQKINAHPLGHLLLNDITFRETASIYQGFVINTFYAIFRGITAYLYHSVWFMAVAIYYLLLGMIRLVLVLHVRWLKQYQNIKDRIMFEFKGYRMCGFFMLLLNTGMSGMVILMVSKNLYYKYPGYVIYVSALYTFYTAITATINIFKFRKLKSPILSASKAITFTGAMMSVMTLQTAMIAQFGGDDSVFRQTANTITGAFVCIGSVVIAFYMIYRGTYHIKIERDRVREQAHHE